MSLEIKRKEAYAEAARMIESRVRLYSRPSLRYICPKDCHDVERRFSSLVEQLTYARLWPVTELEGFSLEAIIKDMKALKLDEFSIHCSNGWHKNNSRGPSFNETSTAIQNLGGCLEELISSVCYKCARSGEVARNVMAKCKHER